MHFNSLHTVISCILFSFVMSQERCVRSLRDKELCSDQYTCSIQEDALLQTIPNIDDEGTCHSLCEVLPNCGFYTWYDTSAYLARMCFLFSSCNIHGDCTGCHTGPVICPSTTPAPTNAPPQDCNELANNPPPHGKLECYDEKCHLRCDPGFATTGPSIVVCSRTRVALACEPALTLVTGGDKALDSVELYSSSTNSCRLALPSLPSLYSDHSLDYVDGQILLCGGYFTGSSCVTMLPNSTWTKHSNLTSKRAHHSSGVHRDFLRLFGGLDSSVEYWHQGGEWKESNSLPPEVPIDGCATDISSTEVILTGGHSCPECVFTFSWEDGKVERLADMLEGRSSHGCTTYLDPEDGEPRVIVAGGWSGHNMRTAEVYNPRTGRWRVVGDLTGPRRGLTLTNSEGGKVLALGGRYSIQQGTVDIFDPDLEIWTVGPSLARARAYQATTAVPMSRFKCNKDDQLVIIL